MGQSSSTLYCVACKCWIASSAPYVINNNSLPVCMACVKRYPIDWKCITNEETEKKKRENKETQNQNDVGNEDNIDPVYPVIEQED